MAESEVTDMPEVVEADLGYMGLVEGTRYAIVLGQTLPATPRYECALSDSATTENFGKIQPDGTIVVENVFGHAWLRVLTAQ